MAMGQQLILPIPLPLFPPPIGGVGKTGKRECYRKVPKWENRGQREVLWILALTDKEHLYHLNVNTVRRFLKR